MQCRKRYAEGYIHRAIVCEDYIYEIYIWNAIKWSGMSRASWWMRIKVNSMLKGQCIWNIHLGNFLLNFCKCLCVQDNFEYAIAGLFVFVYTSRNRFVYGSAVIVVVVVVVVSCNKPFGNDSSLLWQLYISYTDDSMHIQTRVAHRWVFDISRPTFQGPYCSFCGGHGMIFTP